MNQFVEFLVNLIAYYPPEYVVVYLFCGLGVALAKFSRINTSQTHSMFVKLFIGIPFGLFIGLIVIVLWPVYLVASVYGKLTS